MQVFWILLLAMSACLAVWLFWLGLAQGEVNIACIVPAVPAVLLCVSLVLILKHPERMLDQNGRVRTGFRR